MNRNHKITVPEPCHENWDKMTPKDNGRFCLSCTKTVVDFTTMLPEEVQHFFIQNQDKSICGRFKKSQLDTIIIQIPSQVLYSQTHYRKMFLLALFIAMGTTLFSCADKDGNKKKIDKVEVVEQQDYTIVGVGLPPKHDPKDSLKILPPPPPPKTNSVKFSKTFINEHSNTLESGKNHNKAKNKKFKFAPPIPTKCNEVTEDYVADQTIITGVAGIEVGADFPGGIPNFYTFFANEFKSPSGANTEDIKIIISFAVERDGSLTYLEPPRPIDNALKEEITRVLKLSPKWQAAESNGKKIRMNYSLPIVFEKDASETSE